jgi:NAD(P)-binding Rossmann-like domain
MSVPESTTQPEAQAPAVRTRAVIIGTGFSGLGMAIALQRQGVDFVILEKADEIGGTWRDNSYPGCACDVPSHLYSFSFEPKATWSKLFSPQLKPVFRWWAPACRQTAERSAAKELHERIRGRIHAGLVLGGGKVQQEAADDGQSKPCHRRIECTAGDGRDLGQPAIDSTGDHSGKRLLALGGAGVALEKETFQLAQFGSTKVGPHGGKALGRICGQFRQQPHLVALDLLDDSHQEILSRPEVVQQHSVAGANRSGDVAQGAVADPARRELPDERIE